MDKFTQSPAESPLALAAEDGPGRPHRALESVPEIVFIGTDDGRWEYVNRRFYETTGMPAGSALGRGWMRALHPDDAPNLSGAWPGPAPAGAEHQTQCRLQTPAGVYRRHLVRTRAAHGADGGPAGRSGVMTDVHDLVVAPQLPPIPALPPRPGAPGRADSGADDLGAFAHAVAHDLREPLRSIRLITQFLREDLPAMDATTSTRLAKIGDLTARTERLVGALLEHARVGNAPLERTYTNLAEVVADAAEGFRAGLGAPDGQVEVVSPLPTVFCDRVLIGQVFANLIANGLRYNRADRKRVQIGATDPGSGAPAIFVRDNGIGIDPSKSDAVFRMFTRLNPPEEFGAGIGAGLAIVRRIVERHGGRIWLESRPGEGSTFFFVLSGGAP